MFRFILAFIRLVNVVILSVFYFILILSAYFLRFSINFRYILIKQWAKLICLNLGFKIEINKKKIPNGVLVLPVHRSWIDIPLIFSIVPATIISKKEIRKWPVIGLGFMAIDAILVDRSKMGSLIKTFKEIKNKILDNKTVILFPEGTIYEGPKTGKFKNGAFRVAAEHNINIVPIAFEFKDRRDVWVPRKFLLSHYFKTMGKIRTYIKVKIGDTIISNDEKWLKDSTKKWLDDEILKMRDDWDKK